MSNKQREDWEPWPSAGETDEDLYAERMQLIGVRNERDVCSVCLTDYGGTVGGDRSKMTTKYFLCPRCAELVANDEVA